MCNKIEKEVKTCVWERESIYFYTKCGKLINMHDFYFENNYIYCPFCGSMIKKKYEYNGLNND